MPARFVPPLAAEAEAEPPKWEAEPSQAKAGPKAQAKAQAKAHAQALVRARTLARAAADATKERLAEKMRARAKQAQAKVQAKVRAPAHAKTQVRQRRQLGQLEAASAVGAKVQMRGSVGSSWGNWKKKPDAKAMPPSRPKPPTTPRSPDDVQSYDSDNNVTRHAASQAGMVPNTRF